MKTPPDHLRDTISDLVSKFLYYDRKEDEEIPVGEIEKMIADGTITPGWIVYEFAKHISESLQEAGVPIIGPR